MSGKSKLYSISNRLEKTSISRLIFYFCQVILSFSLGYYLLGRYNNGISPTFKTASVDFFDCLYFSVVTVSSLGFGDFRPVGLSRILVMFEVILGLGLIALIIGRFASERQSRLIHYIYAAEQANRITEFCKSLHVLTSRFGIASEKEYTQLLEATRRRVEGFRNYVVYQSRNIGFFDLQTPNRLNAILDSLYSLMRSQGGIALFVNTGRSKYNVYSILRSAEVLCELCYENGLNNNELRTLQKLKYEINRQRILLDPSERFRRIHSAEITEELIETVRQNLPMQPWPSGVHKQIAEDLNLSNSKVSTAIQILIERGVLSRQINGKIISRENHYDRTDACMD